MNPNGDGCTQLQIEYINTHFLVYNNKEYPINFDLLKYSSRYFYEHQDEIENNIKINLFKLESGESIPNLPQDDIETFIYYIQRKQIKLTDENIFTLNYLAHKYEMSQLITTTENYIQRHSIDINLEILIYNEKDDQTDKSIYEDIVSYNLTKYLKNDKIFQLEISTLYRIISKYFKSVKEENKKDDEKEINDFLFKALDKYGRNASVLFEYADFENEENSILNRLLNEYSSTFDFNYINKIIMNKLIEMEKTISKERVEHLEYKK